MAGSLSVANLNISLGFVRHLQMPPKKGILIRSVCMVHLRRWYCSGKELSFLYLTGQETQPHSSAPINGSERSILLKMFL